MPSLGHEATLHDRHRLEANFVVRVKLLTHLEAFISLRSNLGKNLTIERHAASE